MNAQVVCRVRAGVTLTFKIKEKEEAFLGRDPAIAVSVPVEGVSRQHAKIRWDGKAYWLEDLKSTNGTFLNGQAAFRERLKHLDVIGLGRKIDLVFLLRAAPEEAAAATPARQGIVAASLVAEGGDGLAPIEIGAGEMTLGRAASNNVVVESSSVSKVHARIERSADQLLLEDLGSANGTFVNGAKVMTAFLKDGDVVSLAGVEGYRVSITVGELKGFGTSGRMRAPVLPAERQRFAADWKTRFEWDSGEREALEDLRRQIREREREREAQKAGKGEAAKAPAAKGHGAAKPAAGAAKPAAAPAKPAAAAAKPAVAPARSPAAPAKPAASPEKPAAAPAKPTAPEMPPAPPAAKPAAAVPSTPGPKPEAPPRATPAVPAGAKPAAPAVARPPAPAVPPVSRPAPPKPAPPAPPQAAPPPAPAVAKAPPLPPKPAAPPPAPTAPPPTPSRTPAAAAPAPAPAAKPAAILEVRLTAPGFDLSAKETGAHELGRANDAALRVNHPTVSRKHARIILADDRGIAYLQDAGGANGTRLNGKAIERLAPLTDGDEVGVGEVELKVTLRRG